MTAYLISDVTVKDIEAFQVYRTRAAKSITQYGGHYLARGGDIEILEGGSNPSTIIIVEFPDMNRAQAWYKSPEYASALTVRDKALRRNLVLVDGISESFDKIN